jgi:hypothetical protein
MIPDWIFQLIALGGTLATAYAAIKADLVHARITAQNAVDSAKECHARLDKHIEIKH